MLLRRRLRRPAVHRPTSGNQLYDPKGEIACNPLPAGIDPRRCLPLFGSFGGGDTTNDVLQYYFGALRRRAPATASTTTATAFDVGRHRRPVHGPRVGSRRSRLRGQHEPEVVVPRDERHPADRPVPAVRELAVGAVRQAGRPVRPAHRRPVRLLADRRRLLQAADPRDRRAGGRWVDDVLDVLRHRAGLGPPVRRGAHSRR